MTSHQNVNHCTASKNTCSQNAIGQLTKNGSKNMRHRESECKVVKHYSHYQVITKAITRASRSIKQKGEQRLRLYLDRRAQAHKEKNATAQLQKKKLRCIYGCLR
jgi:gentisate 1,2-dioxygenase